MEDLEFNEASVPEEFGSSMSSTRCSGGDLQMLTDVFWDLSLHAFFNDSLQRVLFLQWKSKCHTGINKTVILRAVASVNCLE